MTKQPLSRDACLRALQAGADWLEGIAQERRPAAADYGSMRTDYALRERQWRCSGVVWRTAQTGRALIAAHKATENARYLKGAERAATYVTRQQVLDPSNPALHGLVKAYDVLPDRVSVSALLRSIPLLADMADATGERHWDERFVMAMQWVLRNAYLLQGKVIESFSPASGEFDAHGPWGPDTPYARPLIDEACFYQAYLRSGEASFERAFRSIAERLAQDEGPAGHWVAYPPSDKRDGVLDSRHAYWWGRPMLAAGDAFDNESFLAVASRTAQWFMEVQNLDGGFCARNWVNGYHETFDVSSSVAACAALVWFDFYDHTADETYIEAARDSLRFLLGMQFGGEVEDVNLRGAFIESLESPAMGDAAAMPFFDGTDRLNAHVSAEAAAFAVRALARALETPQLFDLDL